MRENNIAYAAIIAVLLLVIAGIFATIVKPADAVELESDWTWKVYPSDITNSRALREMRLQKIHDKLWAHYEAEQARLEEERLAEEQAWEAEQYYEDYSTYYEPSYSETYYAEYSDAYNSDGPSREMPGYFDSYLETYYSSNVLYHYQTPEWTVDDEGFYRTDEGYYVVGVDINEGIPLGTVVDTGKGEAIVADYGSGAHVHDFYTNW